MNLVPAIGFRTVYSWQEAAKFVGLTRNQLHHLVYSGRLTKRHKGNWPFAQSDLNEFLCRLNSGRVEIGIRNTKEA